MAEQPFLLITNDDGIHAPGLKHLWQVVSEKIETAIVAPHAEKSGSGLSITWAKPLQIREVPWEGGTSAWSVNGTPADCIKMATSVILEKRPQLILSGVNRGSNAGRTVLYSGTVGGVIEGALRDIPGIAFSFSDLEVPPLEATRPYILPLVNHFLAHPLPLGTFLNVTFPCNCKNGVKGVRFAKQGRGRWMEAPERRLHPQGIPYYWLGGEWCPFEEDIDSDVALLQEGYITVVPLHVSQLTDHALLEVQRPVVEALFEQLESDPLEMP